MYLILQLVTQTIESVGTTSIDYECYL